METNGNLFTRDDTFFGVCQGLGEDTGIHPNLLRVGIAFTLFWSPLAAVGTYVALGLAVALSRILFPVLRKGEVTAAAAAAAASVAATGASAAATADPETVMASYAADLKPVEAEPFAEPARLAA
jgi:phage shock protein PspC (stress-responsive transcriptional regulator)